MGPVRAACVAMLLALLGGLAGTPAQAFVQTLTPGGAPVRWFGNFKFNLAGNPKNQNGITPDQFKQAVVHGLQRWSVASGGSVLFDYWQGSDAGVYLTGSEYDGLSTIYFVSNSSTGNAALPPNVLGLTQVWYNTDTGQILETDTVLNDRDFYFTLDPRDTSGYGSGGTRWGSPGKSKVFVENVITHELGHSLGLSHSGNLQSTMLFMESPDQAHLGCDEMTAVRAIYPGGDSRLRGTLTGKIVSDSGVPVFGAHVLAISRRRGTVLASSITDRSGNYVIPALEPGTFFVMAEPYYAGAQTLPSFYSAIRADVCGGAQLFGRTVLTDSTGFRPMPIDVRAGAISGVPTFSVRCTGGRGAAVSTMSSASTSGAAVVFDGLADGNGFGVSDRLSLSTGEGVYGLRTVGGDFEIHALSYSLYSPIRPYLSLLDSSGNEVSTKTIDQVYVSESGFINFDSAIVASDLPVGDYYLRVTSSPLSQMLYPAGPVAVDSVPFVVITGSINESAPSLASSLPFNARCRMDENFSAYASPPGDPPRHLVSGSDQGIGFCGTLSTGAGGTGSGPSLGALIGWFFPFFVLLGIRLSLRAAQ